MGGNKDGRTHQTHYRKDRDFRRPARTAVTTVTGFLKEKLSAPIAGQVDNAISGAGGAVVDKVGDVAAKVGGLFGK